MARVIVERPRIKPFNCRKGRDRNWHEASSHEGMGRAHVLHGDIEEFNENLVPLRRYLERQVGRPWNNKVYSEIAQHLRVDPAVQQHVRDHLHDFVAVKPRRVAPGTGQRGRSGGSLCMLILVQASCAGPTACLKRKRAAAPRANDPRHPSNGDTLADINYPGYISLEISLIHWR
jgi:hypothetical protein